MYMYLVQYKSDAKLQQMHDQIPVSTLSKNMQN